MSSSLLIYVCVSVSLSVYLPLSLWLYLSVSICLSLSVCLCSINIYVTIKCLIRDVDCVITFQTESILEKFLLRRNLQLALKSNVQSISYFICEHYRMSQQKEAVKRVRVHTCISNYCDLNWQYILTIDVGGYRKI